MFATFVTFAVAMMGYFLFKNDKDYNEAVADAKEAAKNARELGKEAVADAKEAARDAKDAAKNACELEKEAQGVLADIEKQTKAKLEEIDTKANDKQKNIDKLVAEKLKEIEKTSKKQKDESSKEFERQRKISELSNKGWKTKDDETAAECYRQIVEDLKEENDSTIYYNWGWVLSELAESKKGTEAEELFNQAIEKYKKAIEIKPNDTSAYYNCGDVFLNLAQLKGGKDAEDLLKQAEEMCLRAESIKIGAGAYNLACVYALRGNEDKCQEWLKVGEKAGTLLTREYAMGDDELKSVQDKDWFKELRWKGE